MDIVIYLLALFVILASLAIVLEPMFDDGDVLKSREDLISDLISSIIAIIAIYVGSKIQK